MPAHVSWSERLKMSRGPRWWERRGGRIAVAAAVASLLGTGALLAGVALAFRSPPGGREEKREARARLVEAGELVSAKVTPVYAQSSGQVVWLIEEGSAVAVGDALVRLDETDVRKRLEEEERQIVPRRTELERAEQELRTAKAIGPLAVRRAEVALERALAAMSELQALPDPDDLAAAELDLRLARLSSQKSARDLERTKELAARDLATATELRQRQLEALDAEANAQLALLRLELLKAGATPLSMESARLQVERARLGVEEARFASEADIVIAEKSVEVARARLAKAERSLERLRQDLANCTIVAPAAGRVAFVDVWKGSKQTSRIEVGETCFHGQVLCRIADPDRVQARILVNEVDSMAVREGMPATVRLTAYPGLELAGRVARVGASASDKNEKLGHLALKKAGRAGVNVVEVLVDILERPFPPAQGHRGTAKTLRGGHTVTVMIDLERPDASERGAAEACPGEKTDRPAGDRPGGGSGGDA